VPRRVTAVTVFAQSLDLPPRLPAAQDLMTPLIDDFLSFLDDSPSPHHAAANAAQRLEDSGYTRVDETAEPVTLPAGSKHYVQRGSSVVAFRMGTGAPVEHGFRIAAAHTDSPNLRIKPNPLIRSHGYIRLGVETYGGVLLATWADRDLGFAGAVTVRTDTGRESRLLDVREPMCRIPNVAIHLNRGVNDKGLILNKQTHLPALFTLSDDDSADPFTALLANRLDVAEDDILTWDLGLYDLTPPAVGGLNDEFLYSARLDNLGSTHAGLAALLTSDDSDTPEPTAVLGLFDHEEVGSQSATGAKGRLLEDVLERIVRDAEQQAPGGQQRAIASSFIVSADMAHAVHPAYSDLHDGEHMPKFGLGPVIKQNVNQRYTTNNDTAARFLGLCEAAGVPCQWFVTRSDLACGSTVGPMISANLGIESVDVGNPMLSMHSAREMCGTADHAMMVGALTELFKGT
jgi:aspartyl aminopeptidase